MTLDELYEYDCAITDVDYAVAETGIARHQARPITAGCCRSCRCITSRWSSRSSSCPTWSTCSTRWPAIGPQQRHPHQRPVEDRGHRDERRHRRARAERGERVHSARDDQARTPPRELLRDAVFDKPGSVTTTSISPSEHSRASACCPNLLLSTSRTFAAPAPSSAARPARAAGSGCRARRRGRRRR